MSKKCWLSEILNPVSCSVSTQTPSSAFFDNDSISHLELLVCILRDHHVIELTTPWSGTHFPLRPSGYAPNAPLTVSVNPVQTVTLQMSALSMKQTFV